MNLQEVIWGLDWIDLAQDRRQMAALCECGNEHSASIKRGEFPD